MKLSKIFGIVLSLHVGVILLVMFQPGCQTGGPKKKPVEPSEENVSVENEFNEGSDSSEPEEKVTGTSPFVEPTRPSPGELIVPSQDGIVPSVPSPVVDDVVTTPGLVPTNVSIYKIQRGDSLWGIARKNGISLSVLLASNPNLSKSSKLSIGQEIMLPAGQSTSIADAAPVETQPISSGSTYVVEKGDSLTGIARKNGVKLVDLLEVNSLNMSSIIRPGQRLAIPQGGRTSVSSQPIVDKPVIVPSGATMHVVKKGENLTRISSLYGVSIKQIMEWNGMEDAGKIRVGQSLIVSGASSDASEVTPVAPATDPILPESPADESENSSVQDFFNGTVQERPIIDAPNNQ